MLFPLTRNDLQKKSEQPHIKNKFLSLFALQNWGFVLRITRSAVKLDNLIGLIYTKLHFSGIGSKLCRCQCLVVQQLHFFARGWLLLIIFKCKKNLSCAINFFITVNQLVSLRLCSYGIEDWKGSRLRLILVSFLCCWVFFLLN